MRILAAFAATSVAVLVIHGSVPAAVGEKVALYALIVGVEKYKDPGIKPLSAQPCRELYDFLVERRQLFSDVNVALLMDEKASKANIEKAFQELGKAGKSDMVIILMDGHGSADPRDPSKFYFVPYDADSGEQEKTNVLMDKKLFEHVHSDRVLFMTGSCFSGGFLTGLERGRVHKPLDFLEHVTGRFGMAAARADEVAILTHSLGMDVFGFFLLKGLRGHADTSGDGQVTVKELFDYVAENVQSYTGGAQHPQLYCVRETAEHTPIYNTPTYPEELKLDVKFFYETDDEKVRLLTGDSVLKSGQHIGVAFKPDADCFVHIFWWDSNGKAGRLFPNPDLTEGTGEVKKGQVYWLPAKGGKRWYVLDDNPGQETVYFVASRERNLKLEKLFEELKTIDRKSYAAARGKQATEALEREINLMGFAAYTVPKKQQEASYEDKERLVQDLEAKLKVAGGDAFYKLTFKHIAGQNVGTKQQ